MEIVSRTPSIDIPLGKWRRMLDAGKGGRLCFDILVNGQDGGWTRFDTVENAIANDAIDQHLVYRLLKPVFSWWNTIGIYQRNLADWDESIVLDGRSFGKGCVNCHTFLNNSPKRMFVGVRSSAHGAATLSAADGKVAKIGAKWGYTAWHPGGNVVVYSAMRVQQFFHQAGMEIRDVIDLDSILLYHNLATQTVKTAPAISDKERLETYPTWSPDGRWLYFCSAPQIFGDPESLTLDLCKELKYDLRRVRYDAMKDEWGTPETVLSAKRTGHSMLLPRISPDGRFLLFCMCRHGCFPAYRPSSDLYMLDLQKPDGEPRRLDINSEFSESWHTWSSNSRWIVFSSKRQGGLFTRLYISYVDEEGVAHKPFVLPQRNPGFYDSFLKTYSVPELVTGPVEISQRDLAVAAAGPDAIKPQGLAITGATPEASKMWNSAPYAQ